MERARETQVGWAAELPMRMCAFGSGRTTSSSLTPRRGYSFGTTPYLCCTLAPYDLDEMQTDTPTEEVQCRIHTHTRSPHEALVPPFC
jgi:hypothetical protein